MLDRQSENLDDLGGFSGRERNAGQGLVQAPLFEKLEREKGDAIVGANTVNLDDVGVLEPGDRLGLGAEPRQSLLVRLVCA